MTKQESNPCLSKDYPMGKPMIQINFDKIFSYLFGTAKKAVLRFNIFHLLLIAIVLHAFVMGLPDGYIFDEAHYVPAALATLKGEAANAEHTPLTKMVIALSISVFGNWWFAWRLPMVVCSIISLFLVYLIAKKYTSPRLALVASSFLLFDVIFFVNGSIAILDIPAVTLGLLGIYLYLDKRYTWSGLSFAVSFLMKEIGLLMLGGVILHAIITKTKRRNFTTPNFKRIAAFSLVLISVAYCGLWAYDVVYKPSTASSVSVSAIVIVDQKGVPITTTYSNNTIKSYITNPIEHMKFAFGYFSGLAPNVQTPASELRTPWSWILPIGDNIFNPVVYSGVSVSRGSESMSIISWRSQTTPMVEYFTVPIMIIAAIAMFKRDARESCAQTKSAEYGTLLFCWLLTTIIPWVLFGMFVQRMSINYYQIYGIPAMALGIPFFWNYIDKKNRYSKWILIIQLLMTIAFFAYYFPIVLFRWI